VADEPAFEELYGACHRRLVAELTLLTGSRQVAEDVVQEAFVRAYARWSHVVRCDQPDAWVRKVAVNLARSRWRHLRVRDRALPKLAPGPTTADLDEHADLAAALGTLPRGQRAALVLHHVAGLPVVEVADVLDTREGTVKSWLSRGRASLVRALALDENAFREKAVRQLEGTDCHG
jgi:RNA polymerase sigma-70 factor (ECF subfamily)